MRLFGERDVPWHDLAFRTVAQTLRWYFEDRERGGFGMHVGAISYPPRPAEACGRSDRITSERWSS